PPAADLTHDAIRRDVHVVERDLGELVGAVRLLDRADLDPGGTEVDDQRGGPAMPRLGRTGAGQKEAPGGVARPARPDLAAVHDPAVVGAAGRGTGAGGGPGRRPRGGHPRPEL